MFCVELEIRYVINTKTSRKHIQRMYTAKFHIHSAEWGISFIKYPTLNVSKYSLRIDEWKRMDSNRSGSGISWINKKTKKKRTKQQQQQK